MWFGVGPAGQAVFGLPGNPVSSLVCLVRYVVPGLQALAGLAPRPPEPVALGAPFRVKPALWYFLPVQLDSSPMLGTVALPTRHPRLGRLRVAARHRRFRRAAARPRGVRRRARRAALSLVRPMPDIAPCRRPNVVPLGAATQPRDRLGRPMHDLRISVMDRCNFRCPYCMPKETFHDRYRFLRTSERLGFNEIVRVARAAVELGVRKVRLTGGEPLLRPRLAELVGELSLIERIEDIALTTNGVLLAQHAAELKANGLRRVTVSLDSLDPAVFATHERRLRRPRGRARRHRRGARGGARAGEGQRGRAARQQRPHRARRCSSTSAARP